MLPVAVPLHIAQLAAVLLALDESWAGWDIVVLDVAIHPFISVTITV
jgi:hypothetical protein